MPSSVYGFGAFPFAPPNAIDGIPAITAPAPANFKNVRLESLLLIFCPPFVSP
jgi:hypothetical protein